MTDKASCSECPSVFDPIPPADKSLYQKKHPRQKIISNESMNVKMRDTETSSTGIRKNSFMLAVELMLKKNWTGSQLTFKLFSI